MSIKVYFVTVDVNSAIFGIHKKIYIKISE